jgi:dynein heavy chain
MWCGALRPRVVLARPAPVQVTTFEALSDLKADVTMKLRVWRALQEWESVTTAWSQTPFDHIAAEEIEAQVQGFMKTALQGDRTLPGNPVVAKLKALVTEFKGTLPVVVNLRCVALRKRHWHLIHSAVGYEIKGVEGFTLGALVDRHIMEHGDAIAKVASEAVQEALLEEGLQKIEATWVDLELRVLGYKDSRDTFILGPVEDVVAALDESLVSISMILGSRFVGPIREPVDGVYRRLLAMQTSLELWTGLQRKWIALEPIFTAPDITRQLPGETKAFRGVDAAWRDIMRRARDDPNALRACTRLSLHDALVRHNEALDVIQRGLDEYLESKRAIFPRLYFISSEELLQLLAKSKDVAIVQTNVRKCFDNIHHLRLGEGGSAAGAGSVAGLPIDAMVSAEGEDVPLTRVIKIRGQVEEWLVQLEESMKQTVMKIIRSALLDSSAKTRQDWILSNKAQPVSTVNQIMFCRAVEAALRERDPVAALRDLHRRLAANLTDLTAVVRSDLAPLQRCMVVTLVTADVHGRDIGALMSPRPALRGRTPASVQRLLSKAPFACKRAVCDCVCVCVCVVVCAPRHAVSGLVSKGVSHLNDFAWQQQLRYYWDLEGGAETDAIVVRQSNCNIAYGHEYEGATSRLVVTPLTDRCWMTLTGALHLKLGGNPAGPAGTGKTESSKDLAKALAVFCVVFNCSEQVKYSMMGQLFSGLAQSGSWACLDEFNRIDVEVGGRHRCRGPACASFACASPHMFPPFLCKLEWAFLVPPSRCRTQVLSVIAQQLLVLREGRLEGSGRVLFEGRSIPLKEHNVVVTMNPGYQGRTELPDNLKVRRPLLRAQCGPITRSPLPPPPPHAHILALNPFPQLHGCASCVLVPGRVWPGLRGVGRCFPLSDHLPAGGHDDSGLQPYCGNHAVRGGL